MVESSLVDTLIASKRFDDAQRYAAQACEIHEATRHGSESIKCAEIALTLGNIAANQARTADALLQYTKALTIRRLKQHKVVQRNDEEKALILSSIGNLLFTADRLDEAIVAYKKSLAICRRLAGGGDNHLSCAWILQNIGRALHAKGELDESIKIQRQSLDIFDKVLDSSSSSSSASKNEHRIRSQSMLQQSTELKQYRDQEISRII